jgi:hypothetical protein
MRIIEYDDAGDPVASPVDREIDVVNYDEDGIFHIVVANWGIEFSVPELRRIVQEFLTNVPDAQE